MRPDIATMLEDSLARLQAGASIESCLARYPEHAEELRSLLELATAVQALPRPVARPMAVAIGEQKVLAAAARRNPSQGVTLSGMARYVGQRIARMMGKESFDMKLATRFTVVALIVLLILGGGTVTAVSANALPGDTLYSVKRGTENLRLLLTTAPEARAQFESKLETIRQQEVRAVIEEGRTVNVRFWGELTDLDNASWTVGGLRVLIQPATDIVGQPAAGAVVEVQARTQADGTMVAQALIVRQQGVVEPTVPPTLPPSPTNLPTVAPSPTPTLMPSPTPTLEEPTPTPTVTPDDEDDCDDCDDDDDDWDDVWGDWEDREDWKEWKDTWKRWRDEWKEWEKAWKEAGKEARKAQKEADKAQKEAEKAQKEAEKARKEAEKADVDDDDDDDERQDQDQSQGQDKEERGNGKAKGHDKHDNKGRGKGHEKYDGNDDDQGRDRDDDDDD